jgi:hypothetical protein
MAKPKIIQDNFEDIINDVANGMSVVKACKDRHISTQSFYDYIETDEKLKETYTRAREDRGDTCTDKIEEYQRKLEHGEIDAQTARVLIDTEKWKAGKFNQRMYGDKQEITHAGSIVVMPTVKVNGKDFKMDIGEDVD